MSYRNYKGPIDYYLNNNYNANFENEVYWEESNNERRRLAERERIKYSSPNATHQKRERQNNVNNFNPKKKKTRKENINQTQTQNPSINRLVGPIVETPTKPISIVERRRERERKREAELLSINNPYYSKKLTKKLYPQTPPKSPAPITPNRRIQFRRDLLSSLRHMYNSTNNNLPTTPKNPRKNIKERRINLTGLPKLVVPPNSNSNSQMYLSSNSNSSVYPSSNNNSNVPTNIASSNVN